MAISLANLNRIKVGIPPLLLIYGVPGVGKSSMALECPDTVYIQISPEAPPENVEAFGFGELTSYQEVVEAMKSLFLEPHNFKHVVFDSLDSLEPLIWQEACKRNNWTTIETPGYGAGYTAANYVWHEFVALCEKLRRGRGLAVTWLARAKAENHEEPGFQTYKRYTIRLHKGGHGILTGAAGGVMFINTKVTVKETDAGFNRKEAHVEGGGTRWLFTDGRPAFEAKNRFNMPDQIALPKGKAWAAIAPYLSSPIAAAPAAAEPVAVVSESETSAVTVFTAKAADNPHTAVQAA
jgi:AAA domain